MEQLLDEDKSNLSSCELNYFKENTLYNHEKSINSNEHDDESYSFSSSSASFDGEEVKSSDNKSMDESS